MSIKPIDYQVMLPKTSDVSKISNNEQSKTQLVQQQQTQAMQHSTESAMRQVYSRDKAHEARIKDKEEKNRDGNKGSQKRQKKDDDKSKKTRSSIRTSTIDIRL